VIFLGLVIGGLSFLNYALFMSRSGVTFTVESADPMLYARATTLAYLTIAFCQFSNILSRRDEYDSILSKNFFSNRILLMSIAGSIILMLIVIYTPFLRNFLQFDPPSLVDWIYVIGSGIAYLVIFEIMKIFKRLRRKQ
jgi:Ca2+-transporting ATPase